MTVDDNSLIEDCDALTLQVRHICTSLDTTVEPLNRGCFGDNINSVVLSLILFLEFLNV